MKFFKIIVLCFFVFSVVGCATTRINIEGEKTFPVLLTQKTPSPTVLIAHGCGGWRDKSYNIWANYLYGLGYNAIIVDSFEFRGYDKLCNQGYIVPPSARSEDFETVAKWTKTQVWHQGKIAVIGFSHGGSTVLNIANNKNAVDIDAVISYYPYCGKQNGVDFIGESIKNPRIPVQVHLGDDDTWTPPYLCGSMENYEVYHYPNATHAFDMPYKDRQIYGTVLKYNKEATQSSKEHVAEFLRKQIGTGK
jgi:dienelactone hydrolase